MPAKQRSFPATSLRLAGFFIPFSVFLLSTLSCRNEKNSACIGDVKVDQKNIILTDSANIRTDLHSAGIKTEMKIDTAGPGIYHLKLKFIAAQPFTARNLEFLLQFKADSASSWNEVKNSFHWVPNLKMDPEDIISQHAFRSPAIILTSKHSAVSFIPDPVCMKGHPEVPYYMDLSFSDNGISVSYGISKYRTKKHVYYVRNDSSFVFPAKFELGMYLILEDKPGALDILKKTNQFLWETYGRSYTSAVLPQVVPFRQYAEAGYGMGLSKYWVDGPRPGTGGITLSTFLDSTTQVYRGRDYKDDLWFHSWFNNARTAYGLYLWGKETDNRDWMNRGLDIMNLLLESPQKDGFFKTIWVPGKNIWVASGQGGGPDLYHVPDNAWTAIWLLRFSEELNKLPGADRFLTGFAKGLLKTQSFSGSFPARIHVSDLSADPVLEHSASGAMPTWFLEEMILRKKLDPETDKMAREAVRRSLAFLEKEVLPVSKFQDYEVFFSCAPNPVNRFDSLTWLFPNNTLSIQWSSEAFLKAYRIFNLKQDLDNAEYCLNILSLYQQVWSPPFIDFYSFGGFGVQNTDAEWSDARQAQFAETYLNFYLATGKQEYLQRSVAACRASFALMAIPENRNICPQNYAGSAYNGEFTGAMAENFGHSGYNIRSGQSGFHWGTGSALTTAAILKTKLGDIFIDGLTHVATGVDGIAVKETIWGDTIRLVTDKIPDSYPKIIKSNISETVGKYVIIDNTMQKEIMPAMP